MKLVISQFYQKQSLNSKQVVRPEETGEKLIVARSTVVKDVDDIEYKLEAGQNVVYDGQDKQVDYGWILIEKEKPIRVRCLFSMLTTVHK